MFLYYLHRRLEVSVDAGDVSFYTVEAIRFFLQLPGARYRGVVQHVLLIDHTRLFGVGQLSLGLFEFRSQSAAVLLLDAVAVGILLGLLRVRFAECFGFTAPFGRFQFGLL